MIRDYLIAFDTDFMQLYHPRAMGQRAHLLFAKTLAAVLLACVTLACERAPAPAAHGGQGKVTVASLVPAATDLIVGMGAADQLVAVSNYDVSREPIAHLPRIGDYQSVDWEQMTRLRPQVLIIFHHPDRVPAAMRQQADTLGMQLVNVKTETLADLYRELEHLGEVLEQPAKASQAAAALRARIEAVRRRVADRPRVRTLVVRDEKAEGAVGPGTFIHELLEIAGGENVVTEQLWPSYDREAIVAFKPDAVLQLLSGVPEHVVDQARRVWREMPQIPAVNHGRVHIINAWYSQQPGYRIADLAEQFARALHPEAFADILGTSASAQDRP